MESICSLCFQSAALFQVPGYTLPTCVKCSEHLTAKGISANFYQSLRQDLVAQQQQQQQQQQAPQQQQNSAVLSQTNSSQQQQANTEALQNSINSIKKTEIMSFDLEKTLQNLDVDILFNEEGSCPLCSKTFSRKSSLLTHIRNHSAERKYVCTYCQKGFTQAANLRNHERIHTNDRPYVCVDCGKAFTQITNLNNHRRLHTGERPFVCIEPDCGRSFAQVTNLNNHMKTHHKVQQYCCNQCPKKFTQVTSLNQHLQAHAGITGFYCPRCPEKTFKQQSQLQTHMKSHGLAFPYECQKCDEKFLQQAHLDQHNKMHDEFKFKCDMCPSSFNQESLLKKHIQRHIEGRTSKFDETDDLKRYITCPVAGCNQGFTVKQHLSKHLLTRHAHSELPPPKRSKKNHQQQGQSHLHSTTNGQGHRGRPHKKSKNTHDIIHVGTSSDVSHMQNGEVQIQVKVNDNDVIDETAHQVSNEDLKCNDCGVIFPNENDLREHIFYKHPERRFMQAILEENKYLMRIQNQQSFVCNLCCNVFKSHLALVRHTAKFHGQLL